MTLFNKKETYTIIADNATNFDVQRFVNEKCVKKSTINITKTSEFIVIDFMSKEGRKSIVEEIKQKFEQIFNVEIGANLIYVTKQEP